MKRLKFLACISSINLLLFVQLFVYWRFANRKTFGFSIDRYFANRNDKNLFKYVLSKMGVNKESINKFLIGNRFHVKLRILSPYSNRNISAFT